jgi:hypothetical protein
MANGTLKALNALSDQVPGLNQKALNQVQAARDISLQRTLGAAPAGQPRQQAQALATQRAMQAGQDIVAQRQQAAGRAEQIRQAALQQRQQQGQQALAQRQLAQQKQLETQRTQQLQQLRQEELQSRKTVLNDEVAAATALQSLGIDLDNKLQLATIKQREDLSRIGLDVKSKLLDARLAFRKDERGRKFTNDRQLADYVASTAASRQDFNAKMSQMKAAYDQKMAILRQSQAQIEAALERGYLNEKDDLDFEAKKQLAQLQSEMQKKVKKEQASARNRQSMFQAGGTIVGAALGSVIPGAGTAAGAAVGGALGSLAGGLF